MRLVLALIGLMLFAALSEGSDRKGRKRQWQQQAAVVSTVMTTSPQASVSTAAECKDSLDEVNAARAKRGLPAFKKDQLLTQAAYDCAKVRAAHLCAGHTASDFSYLPAGAHAESAGCAAWESGFGACAMYDNYTYCGAAWVRGSDGLKYCHIFVR